jgi:alanyl-tRNA synthetase
MRRAMRHGRKLGLTEPFLYRLVDVLVDQMGEAYPELRTGRDSIVQIVHGEEERFDAVLNRGLPKLEEAIGLAAERTGIIPGDQAFHFSDTYGLPRDYIEDLASERGVRVDGEAFERALEVQRGKSRESQAFEGKQGREFEYTSDEARRELFETSDRFEGYTTTRVAGVPILALFDEQQRQVSARRAGESAYVVIERTPFYQEAGGQVSDGGRISADAGSGEAAVEGMTRLGPSGPRAHRVRVISGSLNVRDLVTAEVDEPLRDATRRNHTATHLLHAALRRVLGSHVKQAGSLVAPDRLRFDFAHFAALTRDELDEIERLANEQIYANRQVQTEIRSTQEAMAAGAMALFGEKYGDRVRVVSVPGFSMELCAGTHCRATGDIGAFVIVQESGIAAGVRRIEALTGAGAVRHIQHRRAALDRLLQALNTPEDQALTAVERLQTNTKRLAREVRDLKLKAARDAVSLSPPTIPSGSVATPPSVAQKAQGPSIEISGVTMLAQRVPGLEKAALRELADSLKAPLSSGVVVLASETDGKVVVVVSVTKDLTRRLHAGKIVKEIAPIVGGGGGGRADFAEAGGKQPQKIDELLARSREVVSRMLSSAEPVK